MKLIRVKCKDDDGWRLDKSNNFSDLDKARDKAGNAYDIAHFHGNSDTKPNVYGMEAPSIFVFNNDTDKDWVVKRVTEFINKIPEFIKRFKKYQENEDFFDKSDIRKVVINYNAAVKLAQKWLAANK